MKETSYTLEELADEFGLTPRTARHYILNVLPDHHKKGRGRLARYGKDTYDCFALIQRAKAEGLTTEQISRVLEALDQEQVRRVAEGLEELAIVPTQTALSSAIRPAGVASVSRGLSDYSPQERSVGRRRDRFADGFFAAEAETPYADNSQAGRDREPAIMESPPPPRWQVLYADDRLQITHRGSASPEQREQVRLAARLIKGILED
jgi:DNA-binding transcriptional MerR regulator